MKKAFNITVIAVVLILAFTLIFVACADKNKNENQSTPTIPQLSTPSNIQVDENGLITWDAVPNAIGYYIYVAGEEGAIACATNSYLMPDVVNDFTFSIVAKGDKTNYKNSSKSEEKTFIGKGIVPNPPTPVENIHIAINCSSELKSEQSLQLNAKVTGANDKNVTWSIEEGGEYVILSESGLLTAKELDGDKLIKVVATSVDNPQAKASKVISLLSRPTLTQSMLDAISVDEVSFEGYVSIGLYTIGLFENLYMTYTTVIKTAMNGVNWYAEYENGDTGTTNGLYYKNKDGIACEVGVSFMNDEMYFPMTEDDDETQVSWLDSGLYNNFKGLTVGDFTFDEESWKYVYTGSDTTLAQRMIASANPYDFVPNEDGFALLIEDGEILGIYSKSEYDNTIVEGYRALQELFVAISYGETVEVKTIGKYSHEDIHDDLQTAIDNMRNLESYRLDYKNINATVYTTGYSQEGYQEIVTDTQCYFRDYKVSYDEYGEEQHNIEEGNAYGYKKIEGRTLYNTFYENSDHTYYAVRAYAKEFSNARPTFAFAAELFRKYFVDEEAETTTYYVDGVMSPVASTFYYGVGNDINLYGIFATEGYISSTESFTPYVKVKDGYIIESGFYYYLGSIYGVVEIHYDQFDTATLPQGVDVTFTTREVPTSWNELVFEYSEDSTTTEEDVEINALDYLKTFYNNEDIEDIMPFFGNPLGDTFGFGLTTMRIPTGDNTARKAVSLYYDVPLDVDYTINSSLTAVKEYLLSLGFQKNQYDEFYKENIAVAPVDSSLDLIIYIWCTDPLVD